MYKMSCSKRHPIIPLVYSVTLTDYRVVFLFVCFSRHPLLAAMSIGSSLQNISETMPSSWDKRVGVVRVGIVCKESKAN